MQERQTKLAAARKQRMGALAKIKSTEEDLDGDVAAIQGKANASLVAGYGFTGILVAFLARHNPLAIIPVAVLLGGIEASGGLIQRRMDLPDATVDVLMGCVVPLSWPLTPALSKLG